MWWQNLKPGIYIGIILASIVIALIIEAIRHRRFLNKIPVRVHVNGTRGKSSVTRLIAAGLRAGGYVTSAKTTGTLARFIFPDGHEEGIYRMGHSNIAEQIKIVRKAAKLKSQALVIECMSLQPLLQSVCELKLVRSTHGVLTNARPDHLDVMGPLEEDVALALAGTTPVRGKFFTPEKKHLNVFKKSLEDRKSELYHVTEEDIHAVTDEEIAKFSYDEFKVNVALALKVCESLKVDKQTALKGMWEATPDPGAMSVYKTHYQNHEIIFANGFAANDPVSTEILWEGLLKRYPNCAETIIVVNCRSDRQDRSALLGRSANDWKPADKVLLIGSGIKTYAAEIKKEYPGKIIYGEGFNVQEVLDTIVASSDKKSHLVFGICNIAFIGLELVDYFQKNRE